MTGGDRGPQTPLAVRMAAALAVVEDWYANDEDDNYSKGEPE